MTTRSLPYLRLAIIGLALCCQPSSFAGQELAIAGTAKVKPEQARSIALKARPGAITSEELEKEKGGSGFRYSFVVKSGTVLYEVGVGCANRQGFGKLKGESESGLTRGTEARGRRLSGRRPFSIPPP